MIEFDYQSGQTKTTKTGINSFPARCSASTETVRSFAVCGTLTQRQRSSLFDIMFIFDKILCSSFGFKRAEQSLVTSESTTLMPQSTKSRQRWVQNMFRSSNFYIALATSEAEKFISRKFTPTT